MAFLEDFNRKGPDSWRTGHAYLGHCQSRAPTPWPDPDAGLCHQPLGDLSKASQLPFYPINSAHSVVAIFSPPRHELSVEELPARKKTLPISLLLEMSGKHFLPISEWRELQVH